MKPVLNEPVCNGKLSLAENFLTVLRNQASSTPIKRNLPAVEKNVGSFVVLWKAVFPVYANIVLRNFTSFEINHPGDGLDTPEIWWKMYSIK